MSDSIIDDTTTYSIWYKRFINFLRVVGFTVGGLTVALGFIGLIVLGGLNPRNVINDIYQIIFGLLILLVELRLKSLLVYFKFLTHYIGAGFFYVFLGGLSLGSSWYMIAVGAAEIALGAIYLLLGMFNRQMYDKSLPDQKIQQNNNNTTTTTATTIKDAKAKDKKKNGIQNLPASAFDDIESQNGHNNNNNTTTAPNQSPDVNPPRYDSASTGNLYAGNSASDNPFEEFDQSNVKRSKGGYAI